MELGFSEEQEMFRQAAREFFERECPTTVVRSLEADPLGYSPDMYRKMADLGYLGVCFPEEYGGLDLTFLELAILYQEMGRFLVPSPHFASATLAGTAILLAGSDEQKQNLLPAIASGREILTLALVEPDSPRYDLDAVQMTARPDGDGYVLDGVKVFVDYAHVADRILVAARTSEGLTLFVVPRTAEGVSVAPLKTIGGEKHNEVRLSGLRVRPDTMLGTVGGAADPLRQVLTRAKAALTAWMVGGAEAALDMTVKYAKDRVQFGQPIGSFQAIQHKLANVATEVEGARLIAYRAASALAEGESAELEAAMAKAFVSEAYRKAAAEGCQIHGGYGFMMETDIQLYFRRAKANEVEFGDAEAQQDFIAETLAV